MAAPTIYMWTDPGAPQLTRNSMPGIQAIFQACLIDGYGSKTPPVAGANPWTIPFSDSTSFVLKQGGTNPRKCCVKFSGLYSTNSYCDVVAALDFTALNSPVDVWAGGQSGDRVGMGYSNNNSYKIPWVIVATERALYAQFGYNNGDTSAIPLKFDRNPTATSQSNHHWFFGDYKPEDDSLTVNQMLSYSNYTSTTDSYFCQSFLYDHSLPTGYGAKMLAGNFANGHGSYQCETMYLRATTDNPTAPGANSTNKDIIRYPNPLNGALYLDRYRIVSQYALMGEFPGLLYPVQSLPFAPTGQIFSIAGEGEFAGETLWGFNDSNSSLYFLRDGDWGVE